MKSDSCAFTHNGRRAQNEDYYLADDLHGIYVLADGMGGYKGGEVACRIAVSTCHDYIKKHLGSPIDIDDLMNFIRHKLKEEIQDHPEYASMGTTLCCLYIQEGYIHAIHIGDSKIIIVADSVYESRDHTYAQQLIDSCLLRADEYQHHPMRHILTRCLTGDAKEKFKADYCKIPLKQGRNTFLLCSDGVMEANSAAQTIHWLKDEPDIHKILHTVEQNALKYSKDNSTAIMVGLNYAVNGN